MSVQDKIDAIRDKHNVGAVAAQNVVDVNNPAWKALRQMAQGKFDALEDRPHMLILALEQRTGALSVVTGADAQSIVLEPGKPAVSVHPPLVLYGDGPAQAWVRLHADPDNVRHMIVTAMSDDVNPKLDMRQIPEIAERDELLNLAGFMFSKEEGIWVGPKITFDKDYLDSASWGDIRKLLFGN